MTTLADVAKKIRSKNAGPFWLTIDVFCDSDEAYERVAASLDADRTAKLLGTDPSTLKRFEIPNLKVIKFSIPRPQIQGTREDRDMHGASFANILAGVTIEE